MANWQRTIKLGDVWDSGDAKLIAKTAADRLEALKPFTAYPDIDKIKASLVKKLRKLESKRSVTDDNFNRVWEEVYDWADIRLYDSIFSVDNVCWIDLWEKP